MAGEHSERGETLHPAGEDFVAEVSDLDPTPSAGAGPTTARPASADPASADPADATARRMPLGQRLSLRQRLARQLTTAGVVALAVALMLASVPGVRDQAARAFRGPPQAPTAALPAGSGYIYIVAGAPWATVTLDGRTIAHLPIIGNDPPLWLPYGRHIITWYAAPFAPVTCVLSTPIASTDTCPYDRAHVYQPEATPIEWVVTLFPTLAMLSADQRAALLQTAQSALATLDTSATVHPGEIYGEVATPNQYVPATVATRLLRATLSFQLVTADPQRCVNGDSTGDCGDLGQDCVQFCTLPVAGPVASWSVYAVANLFWTYSTAAGQPVLASGSDVPQWEGSGILVPLRITWDGARWSVTPVTATPQLAYDSYLNPVSAGLDTDPACLGLRQAVALGGTLYAPTDPLYNVLSWQYIAAPQRADGCVAVATISAYTVISPPSAPPPTPLLLRRFGVVLAGNAVAHRLWPSLPVVDTYAQQFAAQVVALSGGTAAGGNGSSR